MSTDSGGNPGQGPNIRVAFSNADATWEESADLVALLSGVLSREGHTALREGDQLVLSSGLRLRPQIESLTPRHPKGAKTCSTLEFTHQNFGTLAPFEYQHSIGDDITQAFTKGFESWARLDLPVILDSLREEPSDSMLLKMTYKPNDVRAEPLKRRVLLGPTTHYLKNRASHTETDHPFCPCCMFTNTLDAFKFLLESNGLHCVRLFAARDDNGVAQADCRVNGEDFDAGRDALMAYAREWPPGEYEFRKQYAIIQSRAD
jgi:hypothetical protein